MGLTPKVLKSTDALALDYDAMMLLVGKERGGRGRENRI